METKAFMNFLAALFFAAVISGSIPSNAEPSQQQIRGTFQTFLDEIKKSCKLDYADDEAKFRSCAETKYEAMEGFFEKLFYYRDNKGLCSAEFKNGTDCLNKYSPSVSEPGGKVAVERADWIAANSCYESAIR